MPIREAERSERAHGRLDTLDPTMSAIERTKDELDGSLEDVAADRGRTARPCSPDDISAELRAALRDRILSAYAKGREDGAAGERTTLETVEPYFDERPTPEVEELMVLSELAKRDG